MLNFDKILLIWRSQELVFFLFLLNEFCLLMSVFFVLFFAEFQLFYLVLQFVRVIFLENSEYRCLQSGYFFASDHLFPDAKTKLEAHIPLISRFRFLFTNILLWIMPTLGCSFLWKRACSFLFDTESLLALIAIQVANYLEMTFRSYSASKWENLGEYSLLQLNF